MPSPRCSNFQLADLLSFPFFRQYLAANTAVFGGVIGWLHGAKVRSHSFRLFPDLEIERVGLEARS